MNFKKITTIIEGSLKKDLEKNADLRYSPGMYAACNFSGRILSWNFMPPIEHLKGHEENKIFRIGTGDNRIFSEAFNRCSRINVELFRMHADFISIRVCFYERSEKDNLLLIDAHACISDGMLSVTGMSLSNRL